MVDSNEPKKYYIDYTQSGGVIEPTPTRHPVDIVNTRRLTMREINDHIILQRQQPNHKIGHAGLLEGRLRRAHKLARNQVLDNLLLQPGLISLGDGFYTGWFYGQTARDNIGTYFRHMEDRYPRIRTNRLPFFRLNPEMAQSMDKKVKQGVLPEKWINTLLQQPDHTTHPTAVKLHELGLDAFVKVGEPFMESFWDKTRSLIPGSNEVHQHFRRSLLSIVILQYTGKELYDAALKEISGQMDKLGITVYPIGGDTCIVRFLSPNRLRVRTLPIPPDKLEAFQRYTSFGDQPMTYEELKTTYKEEIDPHTPFFGKEEKDG